MAGRKPRGKAAKGHKLPEPIPLGKEIQDTQKRSWILNEVIGSGGFGTVYFAADKKKPKEFDYVVKVEYHENGPLFAEMHCYQKIAKPVDISEWVKRKKLRYLGLSPCHGFGSFEHNGSKYRFMVIERFGKDLQKLLEENNRIFPLKTVCLIGLSVMDVLEYIHSCGYIHGDVKAANLLLGRKKGTEDQVYLVDMGLACKYLRDGVHKQDLPDPKKSHNGTPEFTSRDAHRGSFSRRSDLEILAYNLLQWLTGRLPWEDYINDNNKLQREKEKYMEDVDNFLVVLFDKEKCPSGISKFLHYINDLQFEQEPDYDYCRKLLKDVLKSAGYSNNDYTLEFTKSRKVLKKTAAVPVASISEPVSNKENGKGPKRIPTKRKVAEPIEFEDGMVLTPAMQAVLNKKQGETGKIDEKSESFIKMILDKESESFVKMTIDDKKSESLMQMTTDDKKSKAFMKKTVDDKSESFMKMTVQGKKSELKKNKVLQDFKEIFFKQEDCDVTFKVKDQKFSAHKLVLKARSPVFAAAFRNPMKEQKTGIINVEDCEPSHFLDFLHFLYGGEVEILTVENVFSLFTVADKYEVLDLRTKCLEFMKHNLSIDTFCDTIALALLHSEKELAKLSMDFFAKNLQKIIVTVKWQSFIVENPIKGNELLIKALVPNEN